MNREAKDERIIWWCILTWWDERKGKLKCLKKKLMNYMNCRSGYLTKRGLTRSSH